MLATKQGTTARSADPIRSRFRSGHGGAGLRRPERRYAPCCPLPSRGTVLCWIHAYGALRPELESSTYRSVRTSDAGSVARAARRFRRIKTMMTASKLVTASKLAHVAASTTSNVALLPTTPDGIESQGAWGPPVGGSVGERACVRAWVGIADTLSGCPLVGACGLLIRTCTHSVDPFSLTCARCFRTVHSAARACFCGQERECPIEAVSTR